jgi:hypothetical protein
MPAHPSALWVDEVYDRDNASDRRSRYGAYLRQGNCRIADGSEDPGEFAEWAFTIACSPVMSPGYVRTHCRVQRVDWCCDADRRPALRLGLVAPLPAGVAAVVDGTWRGWTAYGVGETRYWAEPEDNDRPAVCTTVTLLCPIDLTQLPAPVYHAGVYHAGVADLDTAKTAVAAVCRQVNNHAGAVLAALAALGGPSAPPRVCEQRKQCS